ncbi:uncharacterized protein BP01DRAFT_86352 [Aspergillus saccharolyticus JOP 1030-1]|uniref:Uncharacterized protein n=1 Tax=Aspergillus saccharolyticus JOP 1030-1 TaxID=1450539 RepID=A0A318ZAB3_9EURO|nr:hypothetical protein BP01DRAFT_86352 [Aspergillus saccharolyticus JOP 1030-1]PYH44276.1 hypothetical protein BP01DRAFT_86352 [Aspergillus saccharolyticus JOP 1030-1]
MSYTVYTDPQTGGPPPRARTEGGQGGGRPRGGMFVRLILNRNVFVVMYIIQPTLRDRGVGARARPSYTHCRLDKPGTGNSGGENPQKPHSFNSKGAMTGTGGGGSRRGRGKDRG